MFAFAELTDTTQTPYKTFLTFVKVLKLTHEKSLNKRAVIEYNSNGQKLRHYITRDRLIAPNIVHSEVTYYSYHLGFEYRIDIRADFFKHPLQHYVSMATNYVITELKVNGQKIKDVSEAAEYIKADKYELERQILARLVDFADELPF